MKASLAVLVLVTGISHRTAFVLFGQPVPVSWLILAAEVLAAVAAGWLAVRAVCWFRSWLYLRPAHGAGGEPW